MVKAKPNQKIHVEQLQTTLDKLDKLEDKPKEELTLRESIFFLRDKLKSALKKGYNYQDLSEILAGQDILISAATLKQYLTESSKKSSSRKTKGKSGSSKSARSSQKTSTNVNSSKEDKNSSLSKGEINRIEESESTRKSQMKTAIGQSKSKKNTKTKPRVLSGLDDDLSSEFNQY